MGDRDDPLAGGTLSDALLEVSGLSARRGSREVLTDVSFEVRSGEILGVIGPNGAGKTTLFECVAGLLPCDGGAPAPSPAIKARRAAEGGGATLSFYMPDAIRPWPDQTVRWTLAINAEIFGRRVDDALIAELDLVPLLDQTVKSLSKGEAKRLDLAIGLSAPHAILFLDEPFDGLDLRQTRKVMELLRRSGRTLVLSIHQLTDAARVCDRFLFLDNGRAIAEGTLEELGGGDLEEVFLARTAAQRSR
jgi:ABC-2 type transport system ATP-binding protein